MKRIGLFVLTVLAGASVVLPADAQTSSPVQVSSDPYTNPESMHQTQVEPDTFAVGEAVLSAFMVGRTDGGSSNIGWAYSGDAGLTWTSGFLPQMTIHSTPSGEATRVADPSVVFDAAHGVWLINSLAIAVRDRVESAIVVSRSPDGLNWEPPRFVADYKAVEARDKNWITCDNSPTSPHYGNCYVAWTNFLAGGVMEISRSSDGGRTWSVPVRPEGEPSGFGVQPIVQPDGTVVVVALSRLQQSIHAVRSTDGGLSFGPRARISEVRFRGPPGYRNNAFPSVEVDRAGRIYAVWQDCRFRNLCLDSGNDTVISTSDDGVDWSPVRAIKPAAPPRGAGAAAVPEGADYLQPGVAVDPTSSGSEARLGLYFFYSDSPCGTFSSCRLNVGFTTSVDGGQSWRSAIRLNKSPMPFNWISLSNTGRMIGDYISASFAGGRVVSVYPLAEAPAADGSYRQAMHATSLDVGAGPPGSPSRGPEDPGGLLGLVSDLLTLLLQLLPSL